MTRRRSDDLIERGKWLLFAVGGTDRRRSIYWNAIARVRAAEMATRREALGDLPPPPVELAADRGFEICEGDALGGTEHIVDEVLRMADFGANLTDLSFSSPLLQFAISAAVVASSASYLGVVPVLTGIQVMRASHVPGPPSGSQLFHCDHEDLRQVKVFVLCSEVSEENGPLTVLDASTSRRVKRALGYRYGGRSLRLSDEKVDKLASVDERAAFVGPPGRVMLVDTSTCLHFGARIAKGAADRLMVQFQYLTPAAFALLFQPGRRRISVPGAGSSAVQRSVLGA